MDRKNHFDIIELVDQLFQRLTYRAQGRSVILSAMSGHKQYAHTIVVNVVEPLIVEGLCGRDRLQCVNNRISGNEDAVLGHTVLQEILPRALGWRKMQVSQKTYKTPVDFFRKRMPPIERSQPRFDVTNFNVLIESSQRGRHYGRGITLNRDQIRLWLRHRTAHG